MDDFSKQIQQTQANADALTSTVNKLYEKLGDLNKQQADLAQADQAGTQYYQTVTGLIDKYKTKIDDASASLTNFNTILGQQERAFAAAQNRAEIWGKAYDGAKSKIDGIGKAADGMGKLLGESANGFKPLTDNLKTATQVTDVFKTGIAKANQAYTDYAERVASGTGKFQAFKETMGGLTQGIGGGVGSLKSFKIALAETGIGLVIIAVAALIEQLQKCKPIMDVVNAATAAVGAVMSNLANFIMHPIDNFKNLGSNMASAAKDAYSLSLAQDKLKDSLSAQEVANESLKSQVDLLKQQTANTKLSIKEREAALTKTQKLENDNYNTNKDLATKARDYAIEDARIKKQLHDDDLARLKKHGTEYARVLLASGKLDQAQFDAIKKADLDLIKLQSEYNQSANDLLQSRETIERDAADKANARREAALAKQHEANEKHKEQIKAMNEFIAHADEDIAQSKIRQAQSVLSGYALEIDETKRHYDDLIKQYATFIDEYEKKRKTDPRYAKEYKPKYDASVKARTELQTEQNKALAAVTTRFQQEDLAKLTQYQNDLDKIGKNARQQAAQQLDDDYNKQKAELVRIKKENDSITKGDDTTVEQKINANKAVNQAQKLNDELETQHNLNKKLLQDAYDESELEKKTQGKIDKDLAGGHQSAALKDQIELLTQQHTYAVKAANKKGEDTYKIDQEYVKKKAALEDQLTESKIHAGDKFINAVLQNSKKDSAIYKAAFLAKKATSVADTIISTRQAVIESLKAYSGIPFIGQALGIAQAAFMAAQGAASIATIIKQKPGFAKGGQFVSDGRGAILPGYSHTDNTNAYLRSGEAVVVSEAMRNPWARNLVSAINVAHGGRDFAVPNPGRGYAIGGIFTDGGNANRYYNQPMNDQRDLANTLAYQMINNFPPIYVDVKDVNNQQNILAQTINRVNL